MPQRYRLPVRPKKVVLFPEIDQVKIYHPSQRQMCIKIYFFHFKKQRKKKQEYKKAKETREENIIFPEN